MSHLRHIRANAVRGAFILRGIGKVKSIPSGKRQINQQQKAEKGWKHTEKMTALERLTLLKVIYITDAVDGAAIVL